MLSVWENSMEIPYSVIFDYLSSHKYPDSSSDKKNGEVTVMTVHILEVIFLHYNDNDKIK